MPSPLQDPVIPHVALSRRTALSLGAMTAGAGLTGCTPSNKDTSVDPNAGGLTGITLTELAKVPVGGAVRVDHPDGEPIIVAQPTTGTVAAFSAVCTHQSCTVVPKGDRLTCPCHGSVFDASSGAVINGPAVRPLPKIQVHVDDGRVLTGPA